MDKETEFTHEGIDYVAVPSVSHDSCIGCAFEKIRCSILGLPSCHSMIREDLTSKIFVVK